MEKVLITKDKSAILKGFAILFMIAHHVLIKEFYINPDDILSTIPALRLQIGMKMCVGIFTFIIGYGFYYNKKYDIPYVYSHIKRLLLRYWFVLLTTILIAHGYGGGYIDIQVIINNIIGISHQYNLGNWYIYFYIFAVLVLPVIAMILNKRPIWKLLLLTLLCGLFTYINDSDNMYMLAIRECTRYMPLLAIGYLCAKTDILSTISRKVHSRYIWILIAVHAIIFRCRISGVLGIVSDVIIVPIFVIAISGTFQGHESKWYSRFFIQLGSASTMMWFIHALPFSDATRSLFQTSTFWVNNIFVLFISITIVSYIVSITFEYALRRFSNKITLKVDC